MKFQKLTAENADTVTANLAKLLKKDPDMLYAFDVWLDDLLGEDAFGTEGQNDPRGDHRD